MKLRQLLPILCDNGKIPARYVEAADREITSIALDSRRVTRGTLFVALGGAKADGHEFIPAAIKSGAIAVLSERRVKLPKDIIHFINPDARRLLAELAATFYGDPTTKLHVVGVTGTNGKTTTTYRTRSVLQAAGHKVGLLGTISYQIGERVIPADNTTPDNLQIQDLFAQMVSEKLTHAVMEVSSHALDMHRVAHVHFNTGVFTSLSGREHLDYHKTIENYRDAKAKLFEMLPPNGYAITNADDPIGQYMADRANCNKLSFGIHNKADVAAEIIHMSMNDTTYRLKTPIGSADVLSLLVGEFNVMNDLAAAASAIAAGLRLEHIVEGLETRDPVPGRLEKVGTAEFFPLVDYAHNEGALDSVLETLRKLAKKRLIVVFGCGGDRDRTKRPAMGAVAEKYCDLIVLTADNSRSEKPEDIMREIESGMSGSKPRLVISDREDAISAAVKAAHAGDVLLVAGKGHENYQIFGDIKIPFDDREVLRRAITARESAGNALIPTEATP